ncbi:MAG TPA: carboxypeptidase-like regulatory domain-containing protein [Pirellulales bacterium]
MRRFIPLSVFLALVSLATLTLANEPQVAPDRLVGMLVDVQGKPLAGARLLRQSLKGGAWDATCETDAQGRFELRMGAGDPFHAGSMESVQVETTSGMHFETNFVIAEKLTEVRLPTIVNPGLAAPSNIDTDELAGRVVDEQGTPLEGVAVQTWGESSHKAMTSKDGTFRIQRLERNRTVAVRFFKAGYSPEMFVHQPTGKPGLVVALGKRTFLTGVVRDAEGDIVSHARLKAIQSDKHADQGMVPGMSTHTVTNETGEFHMFLQPDAYDFQIIAGERGIERLSQQAIHAGANKLDFTLRPGIAFRAVVVDAHSGEPIPDVRIRSSDQKEPVGRSNADGLVIIPNLLPGHLEVEVQAPGYARWWSEQCTNELSRRHFEIENPRWQRNFNYLHFNVVAAMPTAKIELERAVRVRGTVIDPEGNPVEGATVAPALSGSGGSISGDTRLTVRTGPEGRFELFLPASNQAQYNLMAHDGSYGEQRTWANGVLPPVSTKPGAELNDVQLQLTRPGTIRGKVVDENGKPIPLCNIEAHATDGLENRMFVPTTTASEDGTFELKCVRATTQKVRARWRAGEWFDEATPVEVAVVAGETADVQLTAIPLAERPVRAKVLGQSGTYIEFKMPKELERQLKKK